ncbi:MAG: hypothetical protein KC435_13450 [Thermomicrobiales bacterium]|nr:hypothetical protein [Thermomicrobiales bacterium]
MFVPSRRLISVISTLVIILGLSGCGGAPDTQPTSSPASPTAIPPTPTATLTPPTPTPEVAYRDSFSVTDRDGYSFELGYVFIPTGFKKTVINDKPGYSSVAIDWRAGISITNTTPGRNLTFPPHIPTTSPAYIYIIASWNEGSQVCEAFSIRKDFCSIGLVYGKLPQSIGPGETYEVPLWNGTNYYPGGVAGMAGIPDQYYDVVMEGLKAPDHISIYITGDMYSDLGRFNSDCNEVVNLSPGRNEENDCWYGKFISQPERY